LIIAFLGESDGFFGGLLRFVADSASGGVELEQNSGSVVVLVMDALVERGEPFRYECIQASRMRGVDGAALGQQREFG